VTNTEYHMSKSVSHAVSIREPYITPSENLILIIVLVIIDNFYMIESHFM